MIYDTSTQPECWFFFACAGLNITQKLLLTLNEECEEKLFHALMKVDYKKYSILDITTALYFKAFEKFSHKWQNEKPGIMQFT